MRIFFECCFILTLFIFYGINCLDVVDHFQVLSPNVWYKNQNGVPAKRQTNLELVNLTTTKSSINVPTSTSLKHINSTNTKSPTNVPTLPSTPTTSKNPTNSTILSSSTTSKNPTNSTISSSSTTSKNPTNSTISSSSTTSKNPTNSTISSSSTTSKNPTNSTISSSSTTTKNPSNATATKKPTNPTTLKHINVTTSPPSNNSFYPSKPVRTTTPHSINNGSWAYNETRPVVNAKSGIYIGYWSITSNGVRYASFSGIRYVKPMTPQYRFKWAELVDDSKKVIDASEEGSDCPQWDIHRKSNAITGKEDCLFMNIYTPRVKGNYPVMVVIPCGHFVFDSASRYLNGPDYFMDTQEIIMVIFNYRLGPLGYADFRSDKYPSNLGMKDQVLALKWVQKNIAAFGGDPKKVTLQGTSSGAVSVHYHMISPLSKGLFHAGISESGSALDPWSSVYPHRSRELLITLATMTGCEWAIPVSFDSNADSLAECFRNKTAHQLLAATRQFTFNLVQMLFLPVIEVSKNKPFMPVDPFIAREHRLPWLSGQNSDETGIINSLEKPIYWLIRWYLSAIAYEGVPHWLNYAETASDPWNVTATIMYHYARTYQPSEDIIVPLFKKAGEDGIFWNPHYLSMLKHKATKYSYLFGYRQTKPDGSFLHPDRGVTHSEEQFYLFIKQGIDIQKQNPPADANMSRTLVRLWVNFVKYHNPTPIEDNTIPKWEKWTKENNLFFTIGQNSMKMEVDPKLEAYTFWKNLPYRDKMVPFPYYPQNKNLSTRPPHHWHFTHHNTTGTSSTRHLPTYTIPLALILIASHLLHIFN